MCNQMTITCYKHVQAEAELRMIQHSFDEQAEVTRSVLKKIVETHVSILDHVSYYR